MHAFAVTINNYTSAHLALVTLRLTGDNGGNCVLKERMERIGGRWLCYIGVETAPTSGTPHLQV